MAEDNGGGAAGARGKLANGILFFAGSSITILAIVAIVVDPKSAKDIFNIILPVFSAWVGTILAFYFGRENFESANEQVRKIVQRLTPEERAQAPITSIMRPVSRMTFFKMEAGKGDADVTIADLKAKLVAGTSRLPILADDQKPIYMIHEGSFARYLLAGGTEQNTLADFVAAGKQKGLEYGLDKGFVVVSEQTTIADAKRKMDDKPPCQDILVTATGKETEPVTGWVSNVRLAKYLKP